ncbi:MAG: patatin family protein [Ruminiclostridium sp.]|nr:patatin family protein [Ruminiclostridium sp.]
MKIGIVLEGGASRTAYTCGVLDCLLDNEIYLDYVIGVSAGIAYGVSYSSRQTGRNYAIFEKYVEDPRYMGIKHFLGKKKSYYNLDFIYDEMPEKYLPFDWKAYFDYGMTSHAVITNISTGLPEYYRIDKEDHKWMLLRASSSLPILFQPVKIGENLYLDGGITDSIPFEKAFEDGCDKVIVVLTRERDFIKKKEKTVPLIKLCYKNYPNLIKAMENRHIMYNTQLEKLRKLEKEGKALVIAPADTHKIGRTERKSSVLLPYFREGYDYTKTILNEINDFIKN